MICKALVTLFATLALNGTVFAAPADDASLTAPATAPSSSTVTPTLRMGRDGKPLERFVQLHQSFLERGKSGPIGVLFLGDSITQRWDTQAPDIWKEHFGAMQPANFGIGGDRIENVLWRVQNGELDGIHPKVVVLLIGANNYMNSAANVAAGVTAVVKEIHQRLPETKVLLLGVFPRGESLKDEEVAKGRDRINRGNARLARLDDGKKTRYLDLTKKFITDDGTLTKEMMPDGLHPSHAGYQIWADNMQPLLDEMMK